MKPTRPIIRYHGGKWKIAKQILGFFPDHRVYVEAFGGGGSLLLQKDRSYAEIYNDLDRELVNLFMVARDQGDALREKLRLTAFAREEYKIARSPAKKPLERARRTIVKSLMGFGSTSIHKNTGFRSDSNRSGTTPAHDFANYSGHLNRIIERLQGVVIENRDAISCMMQHDSVDTLHYVDPPYFPDTRSTGSVYGEDMSEEDHFLLLDYLNTVNGMVILSGYDNEVYTSKLKDWTLVTFKAFADGAKERTECLWMRNIESQQMSFL